jgi:hypothetical protein
MFSKGDDIFSYGTHFKIAEKVRDKTGDIIFIAINRGGYSRVTSEQTHCVEYAIPGYRHVVHVPDCNWRDWQGVVNHYQGLYYEASEKASRARTKKEDYIDEAREAISDLARYLELAESVGVKIDRRKLGKSWRELIKLGVSDQDVEESARLKNEERKRQAKRIARANKEKHEKQLAALKKWKNNEIQGSIYLDTIPGYFLRINGDKLETSGGVSVGLREARILASKIKKGEDVKGHKIDHYTVISLNGELTVGCHNIDRKEVDRIINQMGV